MAHMPQLLSGDGFVGNGTTQVLNDFLMIPKADIDDAAFNFKPGFRACSPLCLMEDFSCHLRPPSLASQRVTHPMMMMMMKTDEARFVIIRLSFYRRPAPSIEKACSRRSCCG